MPPSINNSSPASQTLNSQPSGSIPDRHNSNSAASINSVLDGNNEPPTANDDAPPPYTPVADPNFERTADVNYSAPYVAQGQASRPPQAEIPPTMPPRPQQAGSHTGGHNSQTPFPPPPQRLQSQRLQGGNPGFPGAGTYNYGKQSQQPSYPPAPSSQRPAPSRPNVPWTYPPGYYCYKCDNTGIKLKNGKQCQDCYGRFARQHASVRMAPPMPMYMPGSLRSLMPGFGGTTTTTVYGGGPPPLVLQPGDPRIGGIQCGRCRGRGLVGDLLGEYNCPTCGGVGRLL